MKKQSKYSRMDESLGMRRGKESSKKQSSKSRRDESMGMKKAMKSKKKSSLGKLISGMDFSGVLERFNMKRSIKDDEISLSKPAGVAEAIKKSQYAKDKKPKVRIMSAKGK